MLDYIVAMPSISFPTSVFRFRRRSKVGSIAGVEYNSSRFYETFTQN